MRIISHRGNLYGSRSCKENRPDSLWRAINYGFMVEVDIHVIDHKVWLGHDGPEYPMDHELFKTNDCIFHAKNLPALAYLLELDVHCFWHENDAVTLTNRGYVWSYPGQIIQTPKTIYLDFGVQLDPTLTGWAICTDNPYNY